MKDSRFFRAGVGTVIYNDRFEVAFFRRTKYPIGVWQFQQGGIDTKETIEHALWRELKEEVGLVPAHIELVSEYPFWLSYTDPSATQDATRDRMGQTHRWYFLKLNHGMKIDLTRATDREFDDVKWLTMKEAIAVTDSFKRSVYERLGEYFKTEIIASTN